MVKDAHLDKDLAKALDSTAAAKLSPEEIFFAELVSRGSTFVDAFVKSHPQSKSVKLNNRASLAVASSKLAKKPALVAYLNNLSLAAPSSTALCLPLSRAAKRAKIAECVATCSDWDTVLRAIDLDNDMSGDRAPRTSVALSPSVSMADKVLQSFGAVGESTRQDAIQLPSSIPIIAIPAALQSASDLKPAESQQGQASAGNQPVASVETGKADIGNAV